jgi:hypothetical protein
VNFVQAAKGAAAVNGGMDIKVIAGRWWDRVARGDRGDEGQEGRWEVGVWSEWSMADSPSLPEFEGDGEMGQKREKRKVVFASRYLISDRI